LQYHYPGHPEPQIVLRDEAIALFESWLDAGCSFVAANTAFDMAVMWANAPHLKSKIWAAYNDGRVYDLAIYEMLRKIELGTLAYCPVLRTVPYFGLWEPVLEHLHIDIRADKKGPDIWRGRYNELDGVPLAQWPQKALKYALDDARYARAIHDLQCSRPIDDYQRQVRYAWSLHLTSAWGLRTEAQMVADLKTRIRGNVDTARPVLIREGILRPKRVFRPWEVSEGLLQQSDYSVSEKAVRERVTRALGDRATFTNPSKTHPNGQVSIAESELWKSEDPGLITLAQIGKDLTELSTFIPLLEQGTQYPINTRFGLAASGRVTSGKDRDSGRGGNTQNLPRRKGVRECFVPRYGYAYGFSDYSAAELCGQAQVCLDLYGWSELAKVFERGQDPHVVTASLLVGKPYQDVYDAIKRGEKWAKDARQLCFHPDTQVLTRHHGWVPIPDLDPSWEVAAAVPHDGGAVDIEWQVPTRLTRRPYTGDLVHLKNKSVDLRVTPNHRMVAWGTDTVHSGPGKVKTVLPEQLDGVRYFPSAGVNHGGNRVVDESWLRLAVAVQADGHIPPHGKGQQVSFGLSKQRKIDRLRMLLADVGADYVEATYTNGKNGTVQSFSLRRTASKRVRSMLDADGYLPWWWLDLTTDLRNAALDEAQYWDGGASAKRTGYDYYTSVRHNADVMQAIAATTGRKSRGAWTEQPKDGVSDSCKLSIKDHHLTRGGNVETSRVAHDGFVYCLTVPQDCVMVRDGNSPVITRNCKISNFGYPGGLSAATFIDYARGQTRRADGTYPDYILALDLATSTRLRDIVLAAYPEWQCVFDDAKRACAGGYGRRLQHRSNRWRGGLTFTSWCNTGFQGIVADGAKHALYLVQHECWNVPTSPLYGCRVVNFVHDEIIMEIPVARVHEALVRLEIVMLDGMRAFIPNVPLKVESAAAMRWYKGAEPVIVDGRVVPGKPVKVGDRTEWVEDTTWRLAA